MAQQPMENRTVSRRAFLLIVGGVACLGAVALYTSQISPSPIGIANAAEGKPISAPDRVIAEPDGEQIAVFAGGCFWGIEGVFEHAAGVVRVESGYAGGTADDATYDRVSDGLTGHAEAVRIVYQPSKISYATLLHIFFSVTHDPTELDRQGPDIGKQYRSAIFPENASQRSMAEAYIAQLNAAKSWNRPIVTRIEDGAFYRAEDYHQDYMRKNPDSGYIVRFDAPKVRALRRLFPNLYRGR